MFYEKSANSLSFRSVPNLSLCQGPSDIDVKPYIVIYTFLVTLCLYYGGYLFDTFCFCKCEKTSLLWHGFLHMISCFGHTMIVIL